MIVRQDFNFVVPTHDNEGLAGNSTTVAIIVDSHREFASNKVTGKKVGARASVVKELLVKGHVMLTSRN